MAVEDSPNGALAAERAGAAVLVVPCEVPVPAGPGRVLRDDLVGLTAAELGAVLRGRRHRRCPRGVSGPCVDTVRSAAAVPEFEAAARGRAGPSGARALPGGLSTRTPTIR